MSAGAELCPMVGGSKDRLSCDPFLSFVLSDDTSGRALADVDDAKE